MPTSPKNSGWRKGSVPSRGRQTTVSLWIKEIWFFWTESLKIFFEFSDLIFSSYGKKQQWKRFCSWSIICAKVPVEAENTELVDKLEIPENEKITRQNPRRSCRNTKKASIENW